MKSQTSRLITDYITHKAQTSGTSPHLIFEPIDGDTEAFTYSQSDTRINQLANAFLALDIQKGDVVALLLRNGPDAIYCWLALGKIGAISLPVNTGYTAPELSYLLANTSAKLIICGSDFASVAIEAASEHAHVRAVYQDKGAMVAGCQNWYQLWSQQAVSLDHQNIDAEALTQIIFTSGTTSRPKGVMVTHAMQVWAASHTASLLSLSPDDITLNPLPHFHVNQQATNILAPTILGGTGVVIERYSSSRYWQQVQTHQPQVVSMPSLVARLLLSQEPNESDQNHNIRYGVYAGDLSEHEKKVFEQRFNIRLMHGFGMTEAYLLTHFTPACGEQNWPSVGPAAAERKIRLVDDHGVDVSPGEVGELIVFGEPGKTIMKGYYNNNEATENTIKDGWLYTGDLMRADQNGYYYFVDRKKDMIKRGGENVAASEVESVVMQLNGISECAAIGVPHPVLDEVVKIYVVLTAGSDLNADSILEYCQKNLAKFKVPEEIEFRQALPRNDTGKVLKKVLRSEAKVNSATR